MISNRTQMVGGTLSTFFAFVLCTCAVANQEKSSQIDSSKKDTKDDFNPKVVIEKKFPSIRNVAIRSMKTADKLLDDAELVLGVVIDNHPRAYAINMLTGPTREIINDDLGGESIAATW